MTYICPSISPAVWHSSAHESETLRKRQDPRKFGVKVPFPQATELRFHNCCFPDLACMRLSNCPILWLPEMYFVTFPISSQSSVGLTLSGTCPSVQRGWRSSVHQLHRESWVLHYFQSQMCPCDCSCRSTYRRVPKKNVEFYFPLLNFQCGAQRHF